METREGYGTMNMCKQITLQEALKERVAELYVEQESMHEELLYWDFRQSDIDSIRRLASIQIRKLEAEFLLSHLEPIVEKI